jgi:putative DNA primase/helicase
MNNTFELWVIADRSGRVEYRVDCPECSKRKNDRTLALNTQKRVGICHRCQLVIRDGESEHFSAAHIEALEHDLQTQRRKNEWIFHQIRERVQPLTESCPVVTYLQRRLDTLPAKLPKVGYSASERLYTGPGLYRSTPAMVAALQDHKGAVTGWHITHLTLSGLKANGPDSRRYHKREPLSGSAIRLYPATDALVIAEGIETALAMHLVTNDPAWATGDAGKLQSFVPPEGLKRLIIAGDNDSNRVGQRAAWSLYHKYKNKLSCSVLIPDRENADWLDMLRVGHD